MKKILDSRYKFIGPGDEKLRDTNWQILPPPGGDLSTYYIEPQLGGWGDDFAKGAASVATKVIKTIENGVKKTLDKSAKQACEFFPAGHELAKQIKSQPGMQQVWEVATVAAYTWTPPANLAFVPALMLVDVMEKCSVTKAMKTQIGAARVSCKVAEFLIPIAGPLCTIVGACCGGVPACAGPVIAGSLQATANQFPLWDDLYKGNYVTVAGVNAAMASTYKIAQVAVSLGLVSDQGSAIMNGDFFNTFGELYGDAKVAAKRGDKPSHFLQQVIKNPPKKATKGKRKPKSSESYSPAFVDDKSVRLSVEGGSAHDLSQEEDDETLGLVLGGLAVGGFGLWAVRKVFGRRR